MRSDPAPRAVRLGVISDIHANLEALQATLATLEVAGVDEVVCCGDVVGYGASPNECVSLLRARKIPTVLGNHDAAVVDDGAASTFNEMARDAIDWTRRALTDDNRTWLAKRPLQFTRHGLLFVHSSPREPELWSYVLTFADARACFDCFEEPACFIGHSHQPFFLALEGDDVHLLRTPEVALDSGVRHLVNVGSVGQPRDRDPRAACVIVDLAERAMRLVRVDYDIAGAQDKIRRMGRHRDLAERLAHGC
jgi:diadenosine tetraphosphatase ApaH/serine/threonine PP2A family protein phosphatase